MTILLLFELEKERMHEVLRSKVAHFSMFCTLTKQEKHLKKNLFPKQ